MKISSENIDFRNKVLEGARKAYHKLVIASAEKDEKLVIADKDGNVMHVPAKELLKTLTDK